MVWDALAFQQKAMRQKAARPGSAHVDDVAQRHGKANLMRGIADKVCTEDEVGAGLVQNADMEAARGAALAHARGAVAGDGGAAGQGGLLLEGVEQGLVVGVVAREGELARRRGHGGAGRRERGRAARAHAARERRGL